MDCRWVTPLVPCPCSQVVSLLRISSVLLSQSRLSPPSYMLVRSVPCISPREKSHGYLRVFALLDRIRSAHCRWQPSISVDRDLTVPDGCPWRQSCPVRPSVSSCFLRRAYSVYG